MRRSARPRTSRLFWQDAEADAPIALHVLPPEANSVGLRDLGIAPGERGLDVGGMLEAARDGSLKALVVARDNPVLLHPDRAATIAALGNLDCLVVIDEVTSGASQLATHVLPDVSAFAKDGHVTNADRQILRLRSAAAVQRNARTLTSWLSSLSAGLPAVETPTTTEDGEPGEPIPAPEQPSDDREARAALAALDSRYAALEAIGATQSRMPINGAATQRFLAVGESGAPASEQGLTLLSGRDLYTDRLSAARGDVNADLLERSGSVQIHPADAAARNIADGSPVNLSANDAQIVLPAEITDDVPQGAVWASLLHEGGAVQALHPAGAETLSTAVVSAAE